MIVRGYSMNLYCENAQPNIRGTGSNGDVHDFQEFPKTYFGETRAEVVREARSDGWIINLEKNTCICPKCNPNIRRGCTQ